MFIIKKKSEEALYKELKSSWENFPTLRCLYLKFSQLEEDIEELIQNFIETLRIYLDDASCQAYICHDNDIFVLTRSMTQKRLDEFLSHFTPHLAPTPSPEGLASLFEIGVDWPRLRTLCEHKIRTRENLKNLTDTQKKQDLELVSRETLLKKLDADLISSLAMRRTDREKPEILVAEDDPFSQKLVYNALKTHYSVTISKDGQGALMNYVNKAPDILFLDIGLPDMNGHQVLKKLFQIDPEAYVVMFSGNGDKENVMKAISLGAKGFVGKPFTQDKLFQYIEKSPFIQEKNQTKNILEDVLK